jgi:hypothetical protein
MADASPERMNQELCHRVDQLFYGTDYVSIPVSEWLGDNDGERDSEGKKPLLVWERELLGRDIFRGLEVMASDRVALLEQKSGELIMERYVCLETENDDEETEDYFSLNMFNGEIYYEDQENHDNAIQEFTERFRIVEDI